MYYDYFGLTEAPFSIAPNPDYLFMTERHQDALAHLYHGIESDAGFVLLTGEVGTGKTTICRSFLHKLPGDTQLAFILNPFLSGEELLQVICQELSIDDVPEQPTLRQLTNSIYHHLLDNHGRDIQTVLLIDEAQHLDNKVLELIRLLTNLETDTHKLLKIILVGQPELNDTLANPELRQLSQRVTARYHISPLNEQETGAYINYRLRMAGYMSDKTLFPKSIVKRIFQVTDGIPRLINVICDRALLGTYSASCAVVNKKILDKAITEVKGAQHRQEHTHHQEHKRPGWIALSLLVASLLVVFLAGLYFSPNIRDRYQQLAAVDKPATIGEENSPILTTAPGNPANRNKGKIDQLQVDAEKSSGSSGNTAEGGRKAEPQSAPALATGNRVPLTTISGNATDTGESAPGNTPDRPLNPYTAFEPAINALIQTIQKNPPVNPVTCDDLSAMGWKCRTVIANSWEILAKYNRPGILTLRDTQGAEKYAAITAATETHARLLDTTEQPGWHSLTQLEPLWTGKFLYLWQPPEGLIRSIDDNASEQLITWLARAFAKIDQRDELLATSRMNDLLKQRIILFQRQNDLVEDGIAGVQTLLKLNEQLGLAVTLNQPVTEQ